VALSAKDRPVAPRPGARRLDLALFALMKALILAAGYATRLYPLTETAAKPLLPVGDRPMLDYLLERIRAVDAVDAIHVVTNHKFAGAFTEWAATRDVIVHDDGTTSEDDRLGAIGDIEFVVDSAELAGDDLLVVAGDNLFDYSLADFVAWWQTKDDASAVVLYDVGDLELVKKYSSVDVDGDDRLLAFTEKPDNPTSTLIATAAYLYHRSHVPLLHTYLAEGNAPDQPGRFLAWLVPRAPVYGYAARGEWRDIGDAAQLLEADNRMRELQGLPTRASYSLD
jgi:glucose-1-phosphate thymidylyltransferase